MKSKYTLEGPYPVTIVELSGEIAIRCDSKCCIWKCGKEATINVLVVDVTNAETRYRLCRDCAERLKNQLRHALEEVGK